MINPYEPPKTGEEVEPMAGYKESLIGFVVGGFCIPVVFFLIFSVFLEDTGSPLIWIFLSVILGIIGFFVGMRIGMRSSK